MTEKKEKEGLMSSIKSFIYLDTNKMYSISSQIFSGLTDYILTSTENKLNQKEEQKGTFFSGRAMGDIIEQSHNHSEKKFLNDYAYNLFENKLIEENKVLVIDKDNLSSEIQNIETSKFIKVTGRIVFMDAEIVESTIKNFNEIGYATGVITIPQAAFKEINKLNSQSRTSKEGNKANPKYLINSKNELKKIIEDQGLHFDEEWIKQLAYIVNFGYSGKFEILLPIITNDNRALFSSILYRNMLKEDEHTLIKKYSRETEKEFTIFGIATQTKNSSERLKIFPDQQEGDDPLSMKEAIMNLVFQLTNVENTFGGKLNYEYVIDPIAVYLEI